MLCHCSLSSEFLCNLLTCALGVGFGSFLRFMFNLGKAEDTVFHRLGSVFLYGETSFERGCVRGC